VKLFEPLGYTADDFEFRADLSRDLMTGKPKKGGKVPADLEKIQVDAAKVKPPESIWECAVRHLMRHGLMIWDSPDGRLVVGVPDDLQQPIYNLNAIRTGYERQRNNILSVNRTQDITQAATSVAVYGVGGGRDYRKSRVSYEDTVQTLVDAGFSRRMLMVDENVKTKEQATRRAKRENALRRRATDTLMVRVAGLSYPGEPRVPFAPDCCADVIVETLGGAVGQYYV